MSTSRMADPALAVSSVMKSIKPQTMRLMQYYQSRFNNRVDSIIDRANDKSNLTGASFYESGRDAAKSISPIREDNAGDLIVHKQDTDEDYGAKTASIGGQNQPGVFKSALPKLEDLSYFDSH